MPIVLSSIQVGWFGRVGWQGVTQTHAVSHGKKWCGNKTSPNLEFFSSGYWPHVLPECEKCKEKLRKVEEK